ncbi:hypothetical protein IWZ03DRAFT_372203 [Phyllosticta citriasiana]|uniref:Secreted protein n=1 Tax=Phyllosticta citriasiana TaxID=595635 RepID=A0ABR1KVZ8_9PEZI
MPSVCLWWWMHANLVPPGRLRVFAASFLTSSRLCCHLPRPWADAMPLDCFSLLCSGLALSLRLHSGCVQRPLRRVPFPRPDDPALSAPKDRPLTSLDHSPSQTLRPSSVPRPPTSAIIITPLHHVPALSSLFVRALEASTPHIMIGALQALPVGQTVECHHG